MNSSPTLESVLAKEDVDHSHVFLPGIVGSWTHLRETQKRIRFFCCPSVWKFLLYQLIFCGNSKEIIEPTTCTYIKGYFYKTWREKLQPLVVSWLGCHSILSFGRLIGFWCRRARLSCCLFCSTHLPPFYQIFSQIYRVRTTHLSVTFPLCCPKFWAPESSIDWALTHFCQEYKEGPGSSSESHKACDDRTCGSFLRVIDTIGQ